MSDTILTDKTLESKSEEHEDNENENENENENKNLNENEHVNENVNENDETLMSSDKDDDYDDENKNENENEDDDRIMSQNKIIKKTNDVLDEIIDKSKSFEQQIKLLEKREDLKWFWPYNDHGDKELNLNTFI